MKKNLKILVLEDNPADAELIKRELKTAGMQFNMQVVSDRINFVKGLTDFVPDIILSDHSLSSFNSLEAFSIVKKDHEDIPFIIVTGAASEEFAVICMKAGVKDYILKKNLKRLPSAIEHVFESDSSSRIKEKILVLEKTLQCAFHEIEEKTRMITESFTYAKKLQNALLPEKDQLSRYFQEWFILNEAKNVVSGDFCWFQKVDNKLVFVVGDCTGHGVSGALMSVVAAGFLDKIVNEKKITKPAEILRNLNIGISRFFKDQSTLDGIDIAICSINLKTNFIEFSGANRPIWIMRTSGLDEIGATRLHVGGIMISESKLYESHYLQAFKGDVLYFFSDGILNQFGGANGKKLTGKKFKAVLSSISGIQLQDQKIILKKFINEWKGDNAQVDDILVAGLKI